MKKFFLLIILFIFSLPVSRAAQDYYPFAHPAEQSRFTELTSQLRCLVCQNQNLAESNSSLAEDLRGQIYQQILHGKSDKEIIDYLITRYGNFILYKPPFNADTLGLWLGPFLFLLGGLAYLFYYIRSMRRE